MPEPRLIRKCVVPAAALVGLAILITTAASAYILPASSILRRMSEARNELQISNLRIDGTLTFAGSSAPTAAATLGGAGRSEVQVDGVLLLKLPARCRLEASTPEGARSVVVWSHGKERTEGTRLEELAVTLAQICPLLATRSSSEAATRAAVERHLLAMKIDARTTSLGRLGGQIAYVLGQAAEGQPQLWIYKDGFLPASIRWTHADKNRWDVRFLDYGSPLTGEAFPRVIELYRGDELLLRFSGLKSDSKAAVAEKLF
jgi:hypothetical protein